MSKLQPLRPTTTQIERLKRAPVGDGFFVFRCDEDSVQLIEFGIRDGVLVGRDGMPLEYFCRDRIHTIRYKIVAERKRRGTHP